MAKPKDISPKLDIPTAEEELKLSPDKIPIGKRQGGIHLFSNNFKRGAGNSIFGSDENGIWLGAAEWGDAPFRVNMEGQVYINDVLHA